MPGSRTLSPARGAPVQEFPFAELPVEVKNSISHRARALEQMALWSFTHAED